MRVLPVSCGIVCEPDKVWQWIFLGCSPTIWGFVARTNFQNGGLFVFKRALSFIFGLFLTIYVY